MSASPTRNGTINNLNVFVRAIKFGKIIFAIVNPIKSGTINFYCVNVKAINTGI